MSRERGKGGHFKFWIRREKGEIYAGWSIAMGGNLELRATWLPGGGLGFVENVRRKSRGSKGGIEGGLGH